MRIKVHTSVIGNAGFNIHARGFLTELNKLTPLKIRNFSVGTNWDGIRDRPHEKEPYMTDDLRSMLSEQSLWTDNNTKLQEWTIYSYDKEYKQDINLVLVTENHFYFAQEYLGYNIAYCVTESTKLSTSFRESLEKFHQIWVASEWQKECYIKQGIPVEKIKVVNEGINPEVFYPKKTPQVNDRFSFIVIGRWEYRKATKELVKAFLKTFKNTEPVDLILLTDNNFAETNKDTKSLLKKYNFKDFRIKTISHLDINEYVKKLQTSNVYLSCSRSEGWNLPLIEAMACGIPTIYSNCSGQLEYAKGKGNPIKILGEKPADTGVGNYYEPDFQHLSNKMRDIYENYDKYKIKAKEESVIIREKFNWTNAAKKAYDILSQIDYKVDRKKQLSDLITCDCRDLITIDKLDYTDGFKVRIPYYVNGEKDLYEVIFYDEIEHKDKKVYSTIIAPGYYASTERTWYTPWRIKVINKQTNELVVDYKLDLKGKTVFVALDSNSMGDNVIWFPQIEEFRKKNDCKVICWTTENYSYLWKENYPEMEFVTGDPWPIKAHVKYVVAWHGWSHDSETEEARNNLHFDTRRSPENYQTIPLGKTASNILGIDFKPIKPILNLKKYKRSIQERYVCINTMSTAQAKFWNYGYVRGNDRDYGLGWQLVIYYLNSIGYKVVMVNRDKIYGYGGGGYDKREMWNEHNFRHVIDKTGRKYDLENRIADLKYADFYIGLNSGMGWVAWMVGTPVITITNLQPPELLVPADKVISRSKNYDYNENICTDCCMEYPFKRDMWMFCPRHFNTEREFECSTTITPKMVIGKIRDYINENNLWEGLK